MTHCKKGSEINDALKKRFKKHHDLLNCNKLIKINEARKKINEHNYQKIQTMSTEYIIKNKN